MQSSSLSNSAPHVSNRSLHPRYPISLPKPVGTTPRSSSAPTVLTDKTSLKELDEQDMRHRLRSRLNSFGTSTISRGGRRFFSTSTLNTRPAPLRQLSHTSDSLNTPYLTDDSGASGTDDEAEDILDTKFARAASNIPTCGGVLASTTASNKKAFKTQIQPEQPALRLSITKSSQDCTIAAMNTFYLTPQTHKVSKGQITILPSMSLLVDFREGERRSGRKGVEVLCVSPEGRKVRSTLSVDTACINHPIG